MHTDTTPLTIECRVHFTDNRRGQTQMQEGPAPEPPAVEPGRVPRLARLMALAIRFADPDLRYVGGG